MSNSSKQNPFRWIILALLFGATTVNYLDRIVLSVLLPEIQKTIAIDPQTYGYILSAFQFTYTIGLLGAGYVIDRLGTRLGYLLYMLFWSAAGALHGICTSGMCLATWRGLLGLTASGNFPAAIKAVAEWFRIEDRAFATSLFNSGASISSIIGPPLIAAGALAFGWRWTFGIFGAAGIVVAVVWHVLYKNSPVIAADEHFPEQTSVDKPGWKAMLRHRETYGIMLGKFFTDPVWWFYLYWMPTYLNSQRGFDLKSIAIAIPVIYIVATFFGFIGGWMPGYLMRRGWPVARARKAVMLGSALLLPVTALAVFAQSPWTAILLVSLACGAHNSWSANIFTLCSDCFPSRSVGSITGLGGFAGGLGGILFSALIPGFVVQHIGYTPVFILMGILHPLAYVMIHVFIREKIKN